MMTDKTSETYYSYLDFSIKTLDEGSRHNNFVAYGAFKDLASLPFTNSYKLF